MYKYAKKIFASVAVTAATFCCACDGSDDDAERTVVDTENWIGSPCRCEGNGCNIMGVPYPAPTSDYMFFGCENVHEVPNGARLTCLQTITAEIAPPAYFPDGYCAASAVKCEGDGVCMMVDYGDYDNLTSCPAGATLIDSTFPFKILNADVIIHNRTCAKSCNSDADCNTAGGISCIEKGSAKFCYAPENFEFMKEYKATSF